MIGCSQEDQPDEDADWRHDNGFEKPGCGRYRNYIAISDGRDGHCREIKNVDEADVSVHTIVKAVSFKPVNEQDNAHQCDHEDNAPAYIRQSGKRRAAAEKGCNRTRSEEHSLNSSH